MPSESHTDFRRHYIDARHNTRNAGIRTGLPASVGYFRAGGVPSA
ncbi:TPA: hypothetical protein ACFM7A_000640 [Neisseria meningitidis]|nr:MULTISPECIES: hypothetical protein [Neisseria]